MADLVKSIKVSSSVWMKENGMFPFFIGWAEGYGAFTYSLREKNLIINYIKNPQKHHAAIGFKEEFKKMLKREGIKHTENEQLR